MPETADLEVRTIEGREVRLRWKISRHGEWLAWCYVPGPGMLPHEGVGFEARAADPETAKAEVVRRVSEFLASGHST
jgi:hypothetical protein